MSAAGVPVGAWHEGQSMKKRQIADDVRYDDAEGCGGWGGKGMRRVLNAEGLMSAFFRSTFRGSKFFLGIRRCIWRSSSSIRGMSRCRYSQINMGKWFICLNRIVRSSAAIKKWLKNHRVLF